MQKILGKPNESQSHLHHTSKRTVSPSTSISSSSSLTSSSGHSSTTSNRIRSSTFGMSTAASQPGNNSAQFDINSLMMAAAAVAAKAQQTQALTNTNTNTNKKNHEYFDYNEHQEGNNKHTDDESDSNYLNKLRRHKLAVSNANAMNQNELKSDLIMNAGNDELSGAKKRKRQFIASNQSHMLNEENGDNNDNDDQNDENTYNGKHMKGCDEKPVSRRKSRTLNYFQSQEDLEEDELMNSKCDESSRNGKEKYYSGSADENDLEDMEVGEINNHVMEEEGDEEEEEEVYQNGLEVGELRNDEEDEVEKENEEDVCEENEQKLQFNGIASQKRAFAQGYGLGDEQNALIASTLANLAQAANLAPASSAGNSQKIFHVDAYCYLCKKEFCNKYFLRTHLANKHKVFLNSNDLSSLSGASMSKLQNDLFSEQKRAAKTNGRSSSASSTESTHSSLASSLSNSPNPVNNQSMYAKKASLDDTASNNNVNNNNNNNNTNMIEDFCELCNKQFCNKYYLKKHKFDVHGILVENNIKSYKKIDESASTLSTPQQRSSNPTINGLMNQQSVSTNSNKSFNTNQSPGFNFPASLLPGNAQSHQLALANMMFVNPYMSPMMQLPHMMPVSQTTTNNQDQAPATMLTNGQTTREQNLSSSPTSSSSSSSSASSVASSKSISGNSSSANTALDILSRLSNTNSINNGNNHQQDISKPIIKKEANQQSEKKPTEGKVSVACDLCKKEFFNEEFLKLHRINKHRITSPAHSSSSSPKPSIDTVSSADLQKLLQQQQKDLLLSQSGTNTTTSTNNKAGVSNNVKAANGLLKQFPPNFDMNSIAGIPTPAIFGIMDSYFAAKMADRVTCDICNKQVCNKYFLKTHKLKVHGCVDASNGSGSNEGNPEGNDYDEDMMAEMANEVTGRIKAQQQGIDIENDNASNIDSNEANELSMAKQFQNSLSQLCSTGNSNPNKALAQLFNKSTLAAMGLDQSNNATALAATLANLANYNQQSTTPMPNTTAPSLNSTQSTPKPKPPALARVSCHICRKELCNKYFLKSHLQNAHHITADDLYMNNMLEQQQSPQQQQNEKLLKAFNMLNGSEQQQRQTQSPATSMRSNSSSYTGKTRKHDMRGQELEDEIEDGQNCEEEEGKQFNAQVKEEASPRLDDTNTLTFGAECNMQPFLFECKEESFVSNFVPCMVYLPVKNKLEVPVNIRVTLKPLDAESAALAAASMNRAASHASEENDEENENYEA